MASIASLGVGSGLDLNSIITQLMTIESQKLTNLSSQQGQFNAQISDLGKLKSLLSSFGNKAEALSNLASNQQFTVTSSNTDKVAISADNTAAVGSYDIVVTQLAQANKLSSAEFNSKTDSLSITGEMQFAIGSENFTITLDSNNDSLEGIKNAINNNADNTSVVATIVAGNDGGGGTLYKLVLNSKRTGEENAVVVTDVVGTPTATLGISEVTPAQDATLTVDGLLVKRATNIVSDAIEGVTLTLKSDDATTIKINISEDNAKRNSQASSAINDFVNAYNSMVDALQQLNHGSLANDNTVRTIVDKMRRVLTSSADTSGAYKMLSDIGVTTKTAKETQTFNNQTYSVVGKLKFDSSKFNTALNDNYDSVVKLFSDATAGFGVRFNDLADSLVSKDGIIEIRTNTLNTQVKQLSTQIVKENSRLSGVEADYLRVYTALDRKLSELQSNSQFLTNFFASNSSSFKSSSK